MTLTFRRAKTVLTPRNNGPKTNSSRARVTTCQTKIARRPITVVGNSIFDIFAATILLRASTEGTRQKHRHRTRITDYHEGHINGLQSVFVRLLSNNNLTEKMSTYLDYFEKKNRFILNYNELKQYNCRNYHAYNSLPSFVN